MAAMGLNHSDLLQEGWRVHRYFVISSALLFQGGTQPMVDHRPMSITRVYPTQGSSNMLVQRALLSLTETFTELQGTLTSYCLTRLPSSATSERPDSSPVCKSLPSSLFFYHSPAFLIIRPNHVHLMNRVGLKTLL